ncbi:MAG: HD domain-containing protein [Patescibacteria group bacterium]
MIDVKSEIIKKVSEEVKARLSNQESGHDWWHVLRVWNNAKLIAKNEEVDLFTVELGALLHDIADWKFHDGDDSAGPKAARGILEANMVSPDVIEQVCQIVSMVGYKGAGVTTDMATKEGEVVQDADRLDALGAIGIARTFLYSGHKNRLMYDPAQPPVMHESYEAYKKNTSPAINHFYEKLLLLKDRMNTKTGKKLAEGRHAFMEEYLAQFMKEWEGKE